MPLYAATRTGDLRGVHSAERSSYPASLDWQKRSPSLLTDMFPNTLKYGTIISYGQHGGKSRPWDAGGADG